MKRKTLKTRLAALGAATVLAVGMLAGCGGSGGGSDAGANDNAGGSNAGEENPGGDNAGGGESGGDQGSVAATGGKILYMESRNSGPQYNFNVALYEQACAELGYTVQVIYGDSQNGAQGNLDAVKNAYTSDVIGLIACQDGGIGDIMTEYPDLWVVGFNNDFESVYAEDGDYHDVMSNDHFLGIMGDTYNNGEDTGHAYAQKVIENGYKKVATMIFPVFAYPKHTVADATFRADIEEYNKTAEEPIEIVGDAEVIMFSPLDESYFMDPAHSDLDAIVGMCAGSTFIYPTVVAAKANGTCPADLQLVTGGWEEDEDIFADCGDDKTIASIMIAAPEAALYPIVMIDNAVQGLQYPDWTGPQRHDSAILMIDSTAKFAAIHDNSPLWYTTQGVDLSKLSVSWDDMKQCFLRWNPDATYADLLKVTTEVTVEDYM